MKSALRTVLRAPIVSVVVVLSLAIGIGANTAIFSYLGATVFRPLAGVQNDVLSVRIEDDRRGLTWSSWLEYHDLRERLAPHAEVLAQSVFPLYIDHGARTERVWSQFASDNFFTVLGVQPAHGRFFAPDEATTPGSAPVAVISHALWHRQFAGSPAVLGQVVRLNSQPFTIIGITPPEFRGGTVGLALDLWVPATVADRLTGNSRTFSDRSYRAYELLALPRPGVAHRTIARELELAQRALAIDFPDSNRDTRFRLLPLWRGTRGGATLMPVYVTLQFFAGLVLIVVCVNTANLLLARATVRRREIGIRLAVGAGAWRIVRLLLTESLLLAVAGTAIGLLIALWSVDSFRHLRMPTGMPLHIAAVIDARALLFAIGLGVTCGLFFGLAPALQLARLDVLPALRGGGGALAGRSRLHNVLVALEVAVALVVLVLAGLFYKSFHHAQHANPGYDINRVLLGSVDLVGRGYSSERRIEFARTLHARMNALPGVEAAAIAYGAPLDLHRLARESIEIEGTERKSEGAARVIYCTATSGYFRAMGIPLVAGTDLAPLEETNLPLDAVINETAARRFWPDASSTNASGTSALGRQFKFWGKSFTVVGIARDIKYESLAETPQPIVWPSLRSGVMAFPTLYVRTRSGDPLTLLPALRATVRDLDPELVLYDGRTLAQHIDNNLAIQRVSAHVLSALAPLALVLAAIGLYAVLAYAIAQRTQEIGVRLTLGATPRRVVLQIMREGMTVVAIGVALGWGVALTLGWYFRGKLTGVSAGDPLICAGIPAFLLLVSALACWLPARKAAEVDPIAALRTE